MPVNIPPGVKVSIKENRVTVKGPKGELSRTFNPDISITQQENQLIVTRPSDSTMHRSLHGLVRSLLANMVQGVNSGYEKTLEMVGVGYRAEQGSGKVTVRVGFCHPVEIVAAPGVSLATEGTTRIKVLGIDKEAVGEMAAKIRAIRPPDKYKGKGIRYAGEVVHLKAGKAGKLVGKK